MYHTIEFASDFLIDLDVSTTNRMEQMRVRKGTRFEVLLVPYVVEAGPCPVEVADLYTQTGSVLRMVPFGFFFFVD
jgi:hypothetical protein